MRQCLLVLPVTALLMVGHVPTVGAAPLAPASQTVALPAHTVTPTLDPRCKRSGKVLCADKSSRSLLAVKDGKVVKRFDARFGSREHPSDNGTFRVYWKNIDHVSSIYKTPMPYAMFFNGGEAVHYSEGFARVGWAGASHGCINIRSRKSARWLWKWTPNGTRVVVTD